MGVLWQVIFYFCHCDFILSSCPPCGYFCGALVVFETVDSALGLDAVPCRFAVVPAALAAVGFGRWMSVLGPRATCAVHCGSGGVPICRRACYVEWAPVTFLRHAVHTPCLVVVGPVNVPIVQARWPLCCICQLLGRRWAPQFAVHLLVACNAVNPCFVLRW